MGRLTHRTTPSCTCFVTTSAWEKREIFRVRENAEIVLATMLKYRDSGAYLLHEFVIMPDHLHAIVTPGPKHTVEKSMQLIKGGSSHEIHLKRGHKMQIWQPGFLEWTIRDSEDYRAKQQYIWRNPVVRELAETSEEWIFSSASRKCDLDPVPERLMNPSGAKAPPKDRPFMSELKLRPPKKRIVSVISPEVIGEIQIGREGGE